MSYNVGLTGFSRCNKKGGKIAGFRLGWEAHLRTDWVFPSDNEGPTARHNPSPPPERAHHFLQSLGSLMQQEAEMQVLWQEIFFTVGDQKPLGYSYHGSREPWARQIPAPGFGSSVLPPRAISDMVSIRHILSLISLLRFLPLQVFCSALWPLPASVVQHFWQDAPGRL